MTELPPTFVKGFHDETAVRKMIYNPLGKTGMLVSKLSIGGGTLASFYGQLNEEEAIKTIQYAIKCGVNYIDTAPYYGQGSSERILGKALKGIPREAYYIATKVGRYNLGRTIDEQFDFSSQKTKESIDISLKYLELPFVDVIQIHDVEFAENLDVIFNETLPAVEEAKKQGKVRYIGFSGYPLDILKETAVRGRGRFDTVLSYARYTMLDDSLLEYLPIFLNENLGVICAAGVAMSLLTNRGPYDWHPSSEETKEKGRLASEYCKSQGVELGKLAIWYSSQVQGPATFLCGMATKEIVDTNLDSFWNGLSSKEAEVLDCCLKDFCSQKYNWEGVEIAKLQQNKKNQV